MHASKKWHVKKTLLYNIGRIKYHVVTIFVFFSIIILYFLMKIFVEHKVKDTVRL